MSGWLVYARGRRFLPGLVAVSAAYLAAPWLRTVTFPVPLNEAGARCALLLIVALLVVQFWGDGLGAEVPAVEGRRRQRLRTLRFGLFAAEVGIVLTCGAVLAATGYSVDAFRLSSAILTLLGVAAAMTFLPSYFPRWFAGTALVFGMLVLGIGRYSNTPKPWAFLLHDAPEFTLGEAVPALVALICGGMIMVLRRAPLT